MPRLSFFCNDFAIRPRRENPPQPNAAISEFEILSCRSMAQRLADIGDRLHLLRLEEMAASIPPVARYSFRVMDNGQNFALSLLRSIKNIVCRVDHGETGIPVRRTPVPERVPEDVNPTLLLLAALVAICGLVIKLRRDD